MIWLTCIDTLSTEVILASCILEVKDSSTIVLLSNLDAVAISIIVNVDALDVVNIYASDVSSAH